MDCVLYDIIEFGINPCILKLVCTLWRDRIDELDREIIQRVQWRIPDKPLEYIMMMLLESSDTIMVREVLIHMSIPIIDWSLVSYLIESTEIAKILLLRVNNRHTREMGRRLGIPVPLPEKEIFKISTVIAGQTSTTALKSLCSIISCGYIDALEILWKKANTGDSSSISVTQLETLLNASLSMLARNNRPFNACAIRWLYDHHEDCLPDEVFYMIEGVQDVYVKEYLLLRISLDIPHSRLKMIPAEIFPSLGKNILEAAASSSLLCDNYLKACTSKRCAQGANIRVLDAIIRHCTNKRVRDTALEIVSINGWDKYLAIDEE